MKDWAVEKLSVFLGFDPETLEEQVYPYLMSLDTFNELVEHLTVRYSAAYSRTIR